MAVLTACVLSLARLPAFEVVDDSFTTGAHTVRLKVLRNRRTAERLEVAPALGGKTEALLLRTATRHGCRLRPTLLDHHRNATAARANAAWKGAMLVPFANRVKNGSYALAGERHFLERNEDRGPYGKNALHGYLYKHEMTVLHEAANDTSASLTLGYNFDGTDAGYPFLLSVNITYTLHERRAGACAASAFTATTTATNTMAAAPLPFSTGWHSYFAVSDASRAVVALDGCTPWNHILLTNHSNRYGDLIPTGRTAPSAAFDGRAPLGGTPQRPTYYDDEFKATAPPRACGRLSTRITDGNETAVLWQDDNFRFVQVYSGAKETFGEDAIAVEAMSSEADAWNNEEGVRILQAGETFSGSFGVYLDP
ncbi:hypothetical protein AB1Y20_014432 [Prymnesium parvum]|uniref:Aldose 1-epimerase n=1 Tax=Prymnesium parvum TaxID=97485 RepID=A0AB34IDP3_PRYPA